MNLNKLPSTLLLTNSCVVTQCRPLEGILPFPKSDFGKMSGLEDEARETMRNLFILICSWWKCAKITFLGLENRDKCVVLASLVNKFFSASFCCTLPELQKKYHRGWVNLFYFIHALFGLLTPFGNFMFRGRKSQSRWKLHKMRVKIPPKKRDFDVVAVGDFFSCSSVFFSAPSLLQTPRINGSQFTPHKYFLGSQCFLSGCFWVNFCAEGNTV